LRKQVIVLLEDVEKRFNDEFLSQYRLDELLRRAELRFSNQEWDAALAIYNRIIEHPEFTIASVEERDRVYLRRAACFRAKSRFKEAVADYSAVIDFSGAPSDLMAKALIRRGKRLEKWRDRVKADLDADRSGQMGPMEDYAKAAMLPGVHPYLASNALVRHGSCLREAGNLDAAIKFYTDAIHMPGAPAYHLSRAFIKRGDCYRHKKENQAALKDCTEAIGLPDIAADQSARALVKRATLYRTKGNKTEAQADYSRAIALPSVPSEEIIKAYFNRGRGLASDGNHDKAIADFTALIECEDATEPEKIAAMLERANSYIKRGDYFKAVVECRWVLSRRSILRTDIIAAALLRRGTPIAR
jgi:tetratricopeptide (TPR) repeat protein